jgi:uncharacterized protein YkwD
MSKAKDKFTLSFLCALSLSFTLLFTNLASADYVWREKMLNQLNLVRIEAGVKPVALCTNLNSSSQKYAEYMARENFFSHTGKNGSTLKSRTEKAKYVMKASERRFALGENIAKGQINVNEVMKSWRNSKGHYRNMIDGNFTHVGFGRAAHKNSMSVLFWVQNFGTGGKC